MEKALPVVVAVALSAVLPANANPPGEKKVTKPGAGQVGHVHHHGSLRAAEPIADTSVYLLDATWSDQHGKPRKLGDLKGRPVVLAMVYTHCKHACPRIIGDMRRIRFALSKRAKNDVALVLVSIDPDRDTVDRLDAFGRDTGLTEQGWVLLRGDANDVRTLAAVLGVSYRPAGPSDFAHSNVLTVLDGAGVVAHQQIGLGVDPKATVEAIEALLPTAGKASHD